MKKIIGLLLASIIAIVVTGCTSVKPHGTINGLDVTRVTTRGIFSPSSTTIVLSDPTKPGTIESIDSAHGPGFVPAVAQASGIAGGAALLRPSSVKQSGGGASSTSGSNASNHSVNNSTSAAAGGSATGGAGGTANAAGGGSNTQNGAVHHNSGNGNGNGGNN